MKKYFLLFLICVCVYSAHFIHAGHGIYGDGNGYWSYTHTLYFQHNLDFHNIYAHLKNFKVQNRPVPRLFWNTQPTKTGALPNHWLIGTGLLWLPGMLILDIFFRLIGWSVSPYSVLWELGPGLSGILMGTIGLFFVEKIITHLWNKKTAMQTVLITFAATNLLYYIAIEPALSHSAIFFVNAVFVYLWLVLNPKRYRTWLIWGILVGLSAMIRITGILIAILPLYTLFQHVQKTKKISPQTFIFLVLYGLGITLALSPQLLVQQVIYGSFFSQPYAQFYITQQTVSFWWLPQSLFSVERGLFIWNPIFLIALLGLWRWSKTNPIGKLCLIYLLALLLAVGFWGGVLSAGFGNRFFIEALPLFIFGIALMVEKMDFKSFITFYGSLILWNILLIIQFFGDRTRMVDQKGLTYVNFFLGQFLVPVQAVFKYFHL